MIEPRSSGLSTHHITLDTHATRPKNTLQEIRRLIVQGILAPGSRIVESELAERLRVSRTPVREALQRLQQEGYVVVSPAGRAKSRLLVAPLTKDDARELYWIVGHIEGLSARQTAQLEPGARAELVRELNRLNQGLREVAETGRQDPHRVLDLDMTFHRGIVEAKAGPRLLTLHNTIKPQTERYWRLYASAITGQLGTSVAEHDEIISAIENGDPDAAERAIKANWENGAERLCMVIDSLGERGIWHLIGVAPLE